MTPLLVILLSLVIVTITVITIATIQAYGQPTNQTLQTYTNETANFSIQTLIPGMQNQKTYLRMYS